MKLPFTKTNRLSVIEMFGNLDWDAMGKLLNGWKDGQRGHLQIIKESKPKSSEQLGYYYAVILPTATKAFQDDDDTELIIFIKDKQIVLPCNKKTVDVLLKLRYAEKTGKYVDKGEMDMAECSAFEDWVIRWLAKYMNCHIPLADPNWRDRPHEP